MSESGQDWNGVAGALAQDPALAGFARDGALLLWPTDGDAPPFANAGGRALLDAFGGASKLPVATRERLRLLAGGLASSTALRLERLRLGASLTGLVTCGCKLVETGSGPALAVGVTASELRRLGITVPKDAPPRSRCPDGRAHRSDLRERRNPDRITPAAASRQSALPVGKRP
jgi:hypothetical protein